VAKQETFSFYGTSLCVFVATLGESYFFFLGVSVLSDEITSIASKYEIRDTTLGTTADCHHFRDLTKMVLYIDILRPSNV